MEEILKKLYTPTSLTEAEIGQCQKILGKASVDKGAINSHIGFLEGRYYQTVTAGPDGASHVQVAYPTGLFYQESDFCKQMRQKEEEIKRIFHEAGTVIDRESSKIATAHNQTATEKVPGWDANEPHARYWFAVSVEYNETRSPNTRDQYISATFGGTKYRLYKDNNTWVCKIKENSLCFADAEVCEKLDEVDKSVATLIATRANQAFR